MDPVDVMFDKIATNIKGNITLGSDCWKVIEDVIGEFNRTATLYHISGRPHAQIIGYNIVQDDTLWVKINLQWVGGITRDIKYHQIMILRKHLFEGLANDTRWSRIEIE